MKKKSTGITYAKAFVQVFGARNEKKLLEGVKIFAGWVRERFSTVVLLESPAIGPEEKSRLVKRLVKSTGVADAERVAFERLLNALLKDGRIRLLCAVLSRIEMLLRERMGCPIVTVVTSHELQRDNMEEVVKLLRATFKNAPNAEVHFSVDRSLVCGFRVFGGGKVVENSAAQLLRKIRLLARQRLLLPEGLS